MNTDPMTIDEILGRVNKYYSEKIETFGPTPMGVDWKSAESQELRFSILTQFLQTYKNPSINDYGCGYGSLVDFLDQHIADFRYTGFDISKKMIEAARQIHGDDARCKFVERLEQLKAANFALASGIFNVRMDIPDSEWTDYIRYTLTILNETSDHGFVFNMLTKYSDKEYMRPDLYYANPAEWFDYCKQNFSRYVALLHDYPLYEFTIHVRKEV